MVGILLRFYGFWSWSFSNDELSALSRTNFNSFSALIQNAIKPDGHPALAQVFLYYWTAVFHKTEFWVRLPFVIAGTVSLFYFYAFGKLILQKKAATLATAVYASSYPLVLYSQLARPYAIGLLAVFAFAFYWQQLRLGKKQAKTIIGFILFGFAGIITHYFSALIITILLVSGLIGITKSSLKSYLLSIAVIVVLFLPHLRITLNQLAIGGLSWVPLPEAGYLFNFIDYAFNDSQLFKWLFIGSPLIAALASSFQLKLKTQLPLLLYFFIPYWVAFYYSIYFSPVIQYSVLIFSLPFLFLFFSSFISTKTNLKVIHLFSAVLVLIGIFTMVYSKQFYRKKPFANFKGVAEKISLWTEKYGEENILYLSKGNNSSYLDFYLDSNRYQAVINHFDSNSKIQHALNTIKQRKKEYVLIAFANTPAPNIIHEHLKINYSKVAEQARFFNAEAILYERSTKKRRTYFETNYEDFRRNNSWKVVQDQLVDSIYHIQPPAYFIPKRDEYALTYRSALEELNIDDNRFITVTANFKSKALNHAHMVMSISYKGEQLAWQSIQLADYWTAEKWIQVLDVLEIKKSYPKQAELTVFFWNREHEELFVDDFKIINFADSDYDYYQF